MKKIQSRAGGNVGALATPILGPDKVITLLEACHVTGTLTNQRRVLAPAARRASAICPTNDTSGATYLMMSHVSSALWTLGVKPSSLNDLLLLLSLPIFLTFLRACKKPASEQRRKLLDWQLQKFLRMETL